MSDRPFVHLHCHTHYSLLDGASRVPELVKHVKSLGMNACAMTDHGNLYGAIEFYSECRKAGVNPVIGYEAYVAPNKRSEREAKKRGEAGFHLTLLARNLTGFKNLIKMASSAYLDGYYYVPRIDKELLEAHKDGLICLSGCASSEFSELILKDQLNEATDVARYFHRLFGDHFYVEIQNNGLDIQRLCAQGAIDIANKLGLPLVATSDAHYLTKDDAAAHDVLLCINTGKTRDDVNRMRYGSDQFYVRAPVEMYRLFPEHAEAVKRSQTIADGVDIQLDFKARHFPVFVPPAKKTPEDYLRELCEQGARERFNGTIPDAARARLDHELGIICRMGFASYFLIVWDFVRFAVENGIPCSARGSACGSLVSYVLKLSHVDPLEYDLLFERFLDPNRSEAPDIDIDFCQDRREEVIAYVKRNYGEGSVAQIATFGTMAARAALRDVGRVLGMPLGRVDEIAKMVPQKLHITLDEALETNGDLRHLAETDPQVRELIDIARTLEGTNRNTGTHAAGVVIADGPITDFVPVQKVVRKGEGESRGGEAVLTTQWVMGDIEKVGLLKMDFLGLRTLTLVENCLRLLRKTRGLEVDVARLPLDDAPTYDLLQRGDAKGVFQFESDGIRELLKRLKPDNIRDIIACTALYRPGPLEGGMVDHYINCKHGREQPVYDHPIMKEVLEETYAVMCYQEQVMQILNRLGGIELASAYACIKAISKKKQEIIDARKVDFLKGAQERGVSIETAEEIFNRIVFFGGYGFNKCLAGGTVLYDAWTGERRTIADVHRSGRLPRVHAHSDDLRQELRPAIDVVENGVRPVFRLKTALGHAITATGNHPFRTFAGWALLEDLAPGDFIAAPRKLEVQGGQPMPRHEIIVLAGLLSEGNTCHPSTLYFYNNDRRLIDEFAEAARLFPDTVARVYQRPESARLEVAVNTGPQVPAANVGGVAVARKQRRCGAFLWAEGLGITGKKADAKAVPPVVFTLDDESLELFLGWLWSGDGFVGNDKQPPFYATSSRQLARDVQILLLRLGVISTLYEKQFRYRDTLRPGFTVHLVGEGSVDRFVERIGPQLVGREAQLEAFRAVLTQRAASRSCRDVIPAEVRTWIDEERRAAGLTWRQLQERSGVSMQEFIGLKRDGKGGFRRDTIQRLAAFFGSERLGKIATSDVYWDRVVSIEPAGEAMTYDLTIASQHNFVADGLVVHNSHSAAYALVSYQTAYLKRHFTPEFMAALLTSEIDDGNKRDIMVDHIADARRMGVDVLPPDINRSETEFSVAEGKIVFGLAAIKGCGRNSTEAIVRAREEGGPFRDLYDFCERIDQRAVNRASVERLIKAGAFDRLGGHRAQLMAALPRALQAATERQSDRRRGQSSLFEAAAEAAEATATAEALPDVSAWPEAEMLKYEKEVLDFYFSSHPLVQREKEIARYATHRIGDLKGVPGDTEVTIAGMLTQVRVMTYKKPQRNGNTRYGRCKIEDLTGVLESVMWGDEFNKFKDHFLEDQVLLVRGVLERKTDEPSLQITRLMTPDEARQEMASALHLLFRLPTNSPVDVDRLSGILKKTPGSCDVVLTIMDRAGKKCVLKLGRDHRINPATFLKDELEEMLGAGSVRLT